MLLDETVAPVELSKTDWARGEPKAEMNAKRVLRRSEIGERRKAAGNWMKQGQRWRYLVFFVFGFLIASVPFPSDRPRLTTESRLGLTLYFVIPRAPLFEFTSTQPLTSTDTSPQVSTIPPTFSFAANLTLAGQSASSARSRRADGSSRRPCELRPHPLLDAVALDLGSRHGGRRRDGFLERSFGPGPGDHVHHCPDLLQARAGIRQLDRSYLCVPSRRRSRLTLSRRRDPLSMWPHLRDDRPTDALACAGGTCSTARRRWSDEFR